MPLRTISTALVTCWYAPDSVPGRAVELSAVESRAFEAQVQADGPCQSEFHIRGLYLEMRDVLPTKCCNVLGYFAAGRNDTLTVSVLRVPVHSRASSGMRRKLRLFDRRSP